MRKILLFMGFTFLAVLTVSCKKKTNTPKSEGESVQQVADGVSNGKTEAFYSYKRSYVTEDYALYHDNHGRLQIFDTESKTDIVYCFNAGCEHQQAKRDPVTNEVIQKGCIAYEISSDCVMLRENDMVFFQDNGQVIRADRQGENRRVIATIPLYKLGFREVFYSADTLFISYYTDNRFEEVKGENGQTQWINTGELSDTRECGIYCVNLSDGTVKELFQADAYNAMISCADIWDGHLYFKYFYSDIPAIGPNLETYGRDVEIPEGLTVENYWEEMPKHFWMDVYDYHIATGELKPILRNCREGTLEFCRGFFAVAETDGTTGLYRYSGERFRELPFRIGKGIRSDSGLVCCDEKAMDEYLLIDENTGEIIKRTKISSSKFLAGVIIGKSVYGSLAIPGEGMGLSYISVEDFWNGDITNAVAFQVW